jgi:hypothetical protein
VNVIFPTKCTAKSSLGKVPMGFSHKNQTTTTGNNSEDLNPPNFLCKSSKRPIEYRVMHLSC